MSPSGVFAEISGAWKRQSNGCDFQGEQATVAAVISPCYRHHEMSKAVQELFENFSPRLDTLIRSGDRVLIKPFLTQMGSSDPKKRQVSHPVFVQCVIEAIKDCGGRVSFGDTGLRARGEPVKPDKHWLFELARATGATPVSFARTGATRVRSGLSFPRYYYLSNVVVDADVVVNCANALPQDKLLLTGSIKNMFNSLVGRQQNSVYEILGYPEKIAQVVVDVFRIVNPEINLIDMTTVTEPGDHGEERHVGLILGSQDAVALDAVATRILGYSERELWTSTIGSEIGIGISDLDHVKCIGESISDHVLSDFPLPNLYTGNTPDEFKIRKNIVHHKIFRKRPVISAYLCNNCGDCKEICPVGAIEVAVKTKPTINLNTCINCGYCEAVCGRHAISQRDVGLASIWNRAKTGAGFGVGPVKLNLRASRNVRVGRTLRGDTTALRQECDARPSFSNDPPGLGSSQSESGVPLSPPPEMPETALVIGAGPGLGTAMAHQFANAGMNVALAARNTEKLRQLVSEICARGGSACAYGCDATHARSVSRVFMSVLRDLGPPSLVVYNVENFIPGTVLEIEPSAFENCWQAMCFGGFIVGQQAAKLMVAAGRGTIIYTGATASLRGRDGYLNLAVGKFGVRALAQVMARELGPKGVHVAHIVIDGGILSPDSPVDAHAKRSSLYPQEVAQTIVHLHKQHASAWTQELDLRPWIEKF